MTSSSELEITSHQCEIFARFPYCVAVVLGQAFASGLSPQTVSPLEKQKQNIMWM
jgi:hypothetical protein